MLLLLALTQATAAVWTNGVFSDHMVLQTSAENPAAATTTLYGACIIHSAKTGL
jgi:hypothetical protein